jgi:UDP-N-acetylglucosamine pyrophosphorylase
MTDLPNSTTAVILAAGKGTRMKSEHPKVAVSVAGRAMLNHVIDHLLNAGIRNFVIVVGYRKEEVMNLVPSIPGISIQYAEQTEQKGTAHALLCTESLLRDFSGNILVASGDMPLVRSSTFRELIEDHNQNHRSATVLSARMAEPFGYGRLVRDDRGRLLKIVEEKDADEAIRSIQEVNTGTYVFESPRIFEILKKIDTGNLQKEYYLTDAVALFRSENSPVDSLMVKDNTESLGANSMEDVHRIEEIIARETTLQSKHGSKQ